VSRRAEARDAGLRRDGRQRSGRRLELVLSDLKTLLETGKPFDKTEF
jgi:hypothetical protein